MYKSGEQWLARIAEVNVPRPPSVVTNTRAPPPPEEALSSTSAKRFTGTAAVQGPGGREAANPAGPQAGSDLTGGDSGDDSIGPSGHVLGADEMRRADL